MSYEEKLKRLRKDIDDATNMKNKAEGQLEALKRQESDLLEELNELGIKPENLGLEIENLKKEIDRLFNEADSLIPRNLINR